MLLAASCRACASLSGRTQSSSLAPRCLPCCSSSHDSAGQCDTRRRLALSAMCSFLATPERDVACVISAVGTFENHARCDGFRRTCCPRERPWRTWRSGWSEPPHTRSSILSQLSLSAAAHVRRLTHSVLGPFALPLGLLASKQ